MPYINCSFTSWVLLPFTENFLSKSVLIFHLFFLLHSYQPIAALLVMCSLFIFLSLIQLIFLMLTVCYLFLSDNWGSFICFLTWAGIKVILAMCWGIPWLNLVLQKIDLEMIKGIIFCSIQKKKERERKRKEKNSCQIHAHVHPYTGILNEGKRAFL